MAQPQSETVLDEAMDLLAQGKRFMALDDYQSATDCLEQSCQLFDAYYGVAKRPCADAYLEYGLALVALANIEAGSGTDRIIKKTGIEGDEYEDEDEGEGEDGDQDDEEAEDEEDDGDEGEDNVINKEEEEDSSKKVEQANNKNNSETTTITPQTNGNHNSENQDVEMNTSREKDNQVEEQTPQPSASTSKDDENKPGTSAGKTGDENGDNNSENEEATTIEIAWEVLCLAKRLYMTDESYESRIKLAETLQKLGEISIEWDNNDNAVSILEECLNIRKAILEPEDRLIALTFYHLGLAYSFKSDTQNANDNFSKAIDVIEKRVNSLENLVEKAKSEQDTASVTSYQKEINELKELLPDMTMRLDDSKEDPTKCTDAFKRTIEEQEQEDEAVKRVCLDKSKPVDDITHLVKRKTN